MFAATEHPRIKPVDLYDPRPSKLEWQIQCKTVGGIIEPDALQHLAVVYHELLEHTSLFALADRELKPFGISQHDGLWVYGRVVAWSPVVEPKSQESIVGTSGKVNHDAGEYPLSGR